MNGQSSKFTLLLLLGFLFSNNIYGQNCTAAFSWDDTDLTIQFFDESTTASGDPIVSWFWDFDDNGATSTQQNPIHTFSEVDPSYRLKRLVMLLALQVSLLIPQWVLFLHLYQQASPFSR